MSWARLLRVMPQRAPSRSIASMSHYREFKPRGAARWATLLVLVAACGDPQLNQWEGPDGFLFVVPAEWSTFYAPQTNAVTPFPFLAEVDQPRLESSDPNVAEVELYLQEIDEPRFRAAWIRTHGVGDADIRLWDGQELFHTESIRVREPAALELDLQPPERLPEWARDPDRPLVLLPRSRGDAVVRFYDEAGNEMVAAGQIESAVGVTLNFDAIADRPESLRNGDGVLLLSGVEDQVSSGDRVRILHDRYAYLNLGSVDGQLLFAHPTLVEGLEVLIERGPDTVHVVVYGTSGNHLENRIMGLAPFVTLDGDSTNVRLGEIPWILSIEGDGVEPELGTIEVRWRDFVETIEPDEVE